MIVSAPNTETFEEFKRRVLDNQIIPISNEMEALCIQYYSDSNILELRMQWNDPIHKAIYDDVSFRTLNHWEEKGLIELERGEDGSGWRKYSYLDSLWLRTIVELRAFNYSIEGIKAIYDQLRASKMYFSDGNPVSKYPILEFYALTFITRLYPTYLLVFSDHDIHILSQPDLELANEGYRLGNHLSISIHEIIKTIFPKKVLKARFDSDYRLTNKELTLLKTIRSKKFDSIEIKLTGGEIRFLTCTENNVETKVHELMRDCAYDRITISRHNGLVQNIRREKKIKL